MDFRASRSIAGHQVEMLEPPTRARTIKKQSLNDATAFLIMGLVCLSVFSALAFWSVRDLFRTELVIEQGKNALAHVENIGIYKPNKGLPKKVLELMWIDDKGIEQRWRRVAVSTSLWTDLQKLDEKNRLVSIKYLDAQPGSGAAPVITSEIKSLRSYNWIWAVFSGMGLIAFVFWVFAGARAYWLLNRS